MFNPKNVKNRRFVKSISIDKIVLDETQEVLFEAIFYDYDNLKLCRAEILCLYEEFKDILIAQEDGSTILLEQVSQKLTDHPGELVTINVYDFQSDPVVLKGLFVLEKFTRRDIQKQSAKLKSDIESGKGVPEGTIAVPLKFEGTYCWSLVGFEHFEMPKNITPAGEGKKNAQTPTISKYHHGLILRFCYYLMLREYEWPLRSARIFCGMRDEGHFKLAKETAKLHGIKSRFMRA